MPDDQKLRTDPLGTGQALRDAYRCAVHV